MQNAALVRAAASLLRQLAGSDGVKATVVEDGGLELVTSALSQHSEHPGLLEQVRVALHAC